MHDPLFVDRLSRHGDQLAVVTDTGTRLTYAALAEAVELSAQELNAGNGMVIVEAKNSPACLVAYLACLRARRPVLLVEPDSTARDGRIAEQFSAGTVFRETALGNGRFESLHQESPVQPAPELCVLLSTSGTTGSPKLVRLSRRNLESNAAAIAEYLCIRGTDRAITTLPPFYSFGMSVINSHLYAGATLLLTDGSVANDEFWRFFHAEGATSFSAVPFTFDVLERIGFRSRQYPSLRYIAQAGGRMPEPRVRDYAVWAQSARKQLFVMYGQTEAGPRMAYVPPDFLHAHPGCIGVAIPGGEFELHDGDGAVIQQADQAGELVYRGPNVMMGYAEAASDLALGAGPDVLHTGDLACRNAAGLYYIVGRKSRFSKIVGLRISLDEIERWVSGQGASGIVSGDDSLIVVAVVKGGGGAGLKKALLERFALPGSSVMVQEYDELPRLPSGKFDYRAVLKHGQAEAAAAGQTQSLLDAYRDILGIADIRPTDSFVELGGDSINFVEVSLAIEAYLGFLPENWEAMPIRTLEQRKNGGASEQPAGASGPEKKTRNFWVSLALIAGLLVAAEVILQVRSYSKTGRSALTLATGDTTMVRNAEWGVKTYRPNLVIKNHGGPGGTFTTNSLGLRSAEITATPALGELRIIVAGASTVAGAYARSNAATFPNLLEQKIKQSIPGQAVTVVNAGIEGYTLEDVEQLVDRALIPLKPNMLIIYPGFNDIARLCRASKPVQRLAPLPAPILPSWILTRDMISKNTIPLREPPIRAVSVSPRAYPPFAYEQTLERMISRLSASGVTPVLVTVARAFTGADRQTGKQLAESALFFNYCLDYDGLVEAGEMYNEAIIRVAQRRNVAIVDLASTMPGGRQYFVDAGHFTRKGEEFVADHLHKFLLNDAKVSLRAAARAYPAKGK